MTKLANVSGMSVSRVSEHASVWVEGWSVWDSDMFQCVTSGILVGGPHPTPPPPHPTHSGAIGPIHLW